MKISIVIPVYNEEKVIGNCLASLAKQTMAKDTEIIVIDDGSTDNTRAIVGNQKSVTLLQQNHQGPGAARNLGAGKAKGEILVFVDADMEFTADFISKLVAPIISGQTIGTFSKDEYLLNKDSAPARCWNLNLGRDANRMVAGGYPDLAPVFRAIKKESFVKAGGFDTVVGYTDDWSLFRKLGQKANAAPGAVFYHRNPETLSEVWKQARWYGKNEFLTRNIVRKLYNLVRYNPVVSFFKGTVGAIRFNEPDFFIFKIVYDAAVFTSVLLSFFGEQKYK